MTLVILEEKENITYLTLNRPEKCNALNVPLLQELSKSLETIRGKKKLRLVILKGAGSCFCAGLDLAEENEEELGSLVKSVLLSLYSLPQVTIAQAQGVAVAGGLGLLAACDLAIATPLFRCGLPEVRRGLIAAQVSALLYRQIGERYLKELLFVAELISATRAYEMGLVYKIVKEEKLEHETLEVAKIILRGGPQALFTTKRLTQILMPTLENDLAKAFPIHQKMHASHEAKEGKNAFLEKREPNFFIE